MNERIKELWVKAADSTAAFPSGQNNSWETQVNFMEKFAESIVQECVSIVDDAERGGSNEIWDNAVKFIKRDLQEHFGLGLATEDKKTLIKELLGVKNVQ